MCMHKIVLLGVLSESLLFCLPQCLSVWPVWKYQLAGDHVYLYAKEREARARTSFMRRLHLLMSHNEGVRPQNYFIRLNTAALSLVENIHIWLEWSINDVGWPTTAVWISRFTQMPHVREDVGLTGYPSHSILNGIHSWNLNKEFYPVVVGI